RNSGVQEFRSSGVQEFRSSGVRDNSDIQHPTPISHHPSAITQEESPEQSTDIRLNFLINANPRATLKVIMDNNTGDYIALNGDGVLRATYYNKGSFDMFGNYNVDHGIYKLTIQNVIKKDFQFAQGGTIVFGGDPYNAALNLQALYTVVGVPLSDLQLGNSFKSNNIRVNCLMNITGTPNQPRVDFALDMPTVGTDAKQMIFNLINSEQEMNQQVLYLLAVGRFYNQGTNNAAADGTAQQSQTSLAMQSLLSGTISQQLNNVLSSLVKNQNWNFGANISTGDQGFYNAEYEGLLSGRLLNNRLLINGEFGYRDNPNATTSFIGDFDLQYLLRPSGNLAIKVYNQTNDRYFTRNSLNTQGVGIIWRKDFNGLRDLLGLPAKKTMPENDSETEPSDSTSVSKSENQE
ncbi:MAG: translocation/assembly module TamB domain-containing protein, partial [Prevotella sp.]|nr:translocation/assembly module TamB domain-containing protein [Prevotella sp.]